MYSPFIKLIDAILYTKKCNCVLVLKIKFYQIYCCLLFISLYNQQYIIILKTKVYVFIFFILLKKIGAHTFIFFYQ